MQLLTRPLASAASTPSTRCQRLLQSARQKLLAAHVPLRLRITAFLRLSCLALEGSGTYSHLMQTLLEQNPDWWSTCDVLPTGTLKSTDAKVQKQLRCILQLHLVERE
jgi:hypothetical protein